MKRISCILALICVLLGAMLLACSCGDDETPATSTTASTTQPSTQNSSTVPSTPDDDADSTIATYTINALDAFGAKLEETVVLEIFDEMGNPVSGMVMMKNGTYSRELTKGYYTFAISPVDMDEQYYYDESACYLTETETEASVSIYNYADESNRQEIWAYDEATMDHIPHNAVAVGEGGTYVKIENPSMTYFIFTPTRGGIYRVSYVSSKSVTIGYFGSPHNVLQSCPLDVVDGAFEFEVKNGGVQMGNQGGTTQIVIGIRSFAVKNCVLKIERIGDPIEELPWVNVEADKSATKVDNYLNSEFTDFDVTDSALKVVFNEDDGYYHLNDKNGPLIYIRISSAVIKESSDSETIYAFLPSFVDMCGTDRLGKVFYDDDGNIVLKESYNDMFYSYSELCGTMGLYPLNKQLADAVKNIGEHKGWYALTKEYHIFGDLAPNVVKENAWLFACCYETQFAKGTEESPAPVQVSTQNEIKTYSVMLKNGEAVYLRTIANATLTIANADGIKVVANGGNEYVADTEGKISVNVTANQSFTIVYEGIEETTAVYFTFVEYFN